MTRAILSLMTGLWGGATMLALFQMSPEPAMLALAMGAATLAGLVTAPLWTRPHPIWVMAAAVLATSLGAALAGAWMFYPGEVGLGLIAAPLMVWTGMARDPAVLLVWLLGAAVLRLTALNLRP